MFRLVKKNYADSEKIIFFLRIRKFSIFANISLTYETRFRHIAPFRFQFTKGIGKQVEMRYC